MRTVYRNMNASPKAEIAYFRLPRQGPEVVLEAAVARSIDSVMGSTEFPRWLAGSLPLGAGMPDLLAVSWDPRVIAIASQDIANASILAYLRAVGCARFGTIVSRLGRGALNVSDSLEALVQASVVVRESQRYSLDPVWRTILPEVVAIEAKVSDWRRAVSQAARNQLFSHRSFIALPSTLAKRVAELEPLRRLGLGVLSVDGEGETTIVRNAQRRQPRVWAYYYELAHRVSQNAPSPHAFHYSYRAGAS